MGDSLRLKLGFRLKVVGGGPRNPLPVDGNPLVRIPRHQPIVVCQKIRPVFPDIPERFIPAVAIRECIQHSYPHRARRALATTPIVAPPNPRRHARNPFPRNPQSAPAPPSPLAAIRNIR